MPGKCICKCTITFWDVCCCEDKVTFCCEKEYVSQEMHHEYVSRVT